MEETGPVDKSYKADTQEGAELSRLPGKYLEQGKETMKAYGIIYKGGRLAKRPSLKLEVKPSRPTGKHLEQEQEKELQGKGDAAARTARPGSFTPGLQDSPSPRTSSSPPPLPPPRISPPHLLHPGYGVLRSKGPSAHRNY